MRSHSKPSPVIISQPKAPPAQLSPKNAILFNQVRKCLPLRAIEPPRQNKEQHPQV